ncbi:hypothetical protein [Mycobacterium sp.]|uniref:hypothetical protein n=1 Tax=Mycobacterium sp. TaxID=1785 RepID=UPI003F96B5FF
MVAGNPRATPAAAGKRATQTGAGRSHGAAADLAAWSGTSRSGPLHRPRSPKRDSGSAGFEVLSTASKHFITELGRNFQVIYEQANAHGQKVQTAGVNMANTDTAVGSNRA